MSDDASSAVADRTGAQRAGRVSADTSPHDLWVFAYGSLMWRPGFAFAERRGALLTGWRRCFCIYSVYHRGSPKRPGLVLGLDRGGSCRGVAYRISATDVPAVTAYLRAREQVNGVYRATRVMVDAPGLDLEPDRHPVDALAFIAETAHPSYAGRLSVADQARLIRAATGLSGPNLDYLASTLLHLAELGIRERELERVAALAGHGLTRGNGGERTARILGLVRTLAGTAVTAPVMSPIQRRRFTHRLRSGV